MDAVLVAAYARRAELLKELRKIEKVIGVLTAVDEHNEARSVSSRHFEISQNQAEVAEKKLNQEPDNARIGGGQNQAASPDEIREAARAAIMAAGRPLTRSELFDRLTDAGIEVAGTDKIKVLGTTLWRAHDEFVNLQKFGYWIKDMPYAPALYIPEFDDDEHWSESEFDFAGDNS